MFISLSYRYKPLISENIKKRKQTLNEISEKKIIIFKHFPSNTQILFFTIEKKTTTKIRITTMNNRLANNRTKKIFPIRKILNSPIAKSYVSHFKQSTSGSKSPPDARFRTNIYKQALTARSGGNIYTHKQTQKNTRIHYKCTIGILR